MSASEAAVIGLDIGTSRIVLARKEGDQYRFYSQLNAFISLPFSKLTANVFQMEKIPHAIADGRIVVYGDASEHFADLLHTETRRPMVEGTLNPAEPDGLAVVRSLVELLAGPVERAGTRVYYSVPAPPLEASEEVAKFHQGALRQMLSECGFIPQSVDEGLAVVYAELADSNYTGIGVSCGAGLSNVCVAYLSVPVASFSIPKAGDYVDAGAAAAAGEVPTRVRILKEQHFNLNGHRDDVLPAKLRQSLRLYYDELIRSLIEGIKQAVAELRLPRLGRPVPLVLAGGSVMPAGFRERFEELLRQSGFPLPVSEVRLASDPLHATAKGALIAALADA